MSKAKRIIRGGPKTVQEAMDRLAIDPQFRITVAVANNPDAIAMRYAALYALPTKVATVAALTNSLLALWGQGRTDEVRHIIRVPWIANKTPLLDEAYERMSEAINSDPV